MLLLGPVEVAALTTTDGESARLNRLLARLRDVYECCYGSEEGSEAAACQRVLGEIDPRPPPGRAADADTAPPATAAEEDALGTFLESVGLSHFAPRFAEAMLDLPTLSGLSDADLASDLAEVIEDHDDEVTEEGCGTHGEGCDHVINSSA